MANNGRAKGQISLSGARTVRNSSNPAKRNPHTNSTVGLKGAKATKNTHKPRVHGRPSVKQEGLMRSKGSKASTNLSRGAGNKISGSQNVYNPHATPTVGLRGAKLGDTKGTAKRSNLSKTSPRAINSLGLKKANRRAPLQSIQSAGTGKIYTGGRGTPFKGNARVQGAAKGASSIPAVIRRAASRGPANGSSKPSFTSRVAKILSK